MYRLTERGLPLRANSVGPLLRGCDGRHWGWVLLQS